MIPRKSSRRETSMKSLSEWVSPNSLNAYETTLALMTEAAVARRLTDMSRHRARRSRRERSSRRISVRGMMV